MKKFKAFAPALATLIVLAVGLIFLPFFPAHAQSNNNVNVVGYTLTSDPCQNPTVPKTSIPIAITSATTTQLVAVSAGKSIYVCGGKTSLSGTTPSILFEYGTSTNCTGTHALTGTITPTTGSIFSLDGQGVQLKAPASNGLCVVTAGTGTPLWEGYLEYVQQ